MEWIYMIFLWVLCIAFGIAVMFSPPILLGMFLRTVFRKVSDSLLSLLGGSAILLVLSVISNSYSDTANFFASQVLFLWQFTPVIAVIIAFVFLLSAMAIPFLMVNFGVNIMDKIKSKRKNPEPAL